MDEALSMDHASSVVARSLVVTRTGAFRGQQPGERVIVMAHPARVLLLLPGWLMMLSGLALAAWEIAQSMGFIAGSIVAIGQLALGLATLLTLAHWLITTAYPWWYTRMIITDRRVIMQRGGIRLAMDEIPLEQVQAAKVELRALGEWLLGYGRVTIAAAGGDPVTFVGVARPQIFANQMMQAQAQHAPAITTSAEIADPAIRAIIDRLAQAQPLPPMPPLDPVASVEWPLRHAMTIPLEDGEMVLGIVSRHWWALLRRVGMPLALLPGAALLALAGAWLHVPLTLAALPVGIVGLLWFLLVYLNFVDDSFILTNRRILDVNRRFFVLFEATDAIDYGNIQEVTTTIPSAWARMAKFGTVKVAVGGTSTLVIMDSVPHPQLIEAAIEQYRTVSQQGVQATAVNQERVEMRNWFATVVDEMIVLAPDLRGLPLEAAITHAYAAGLRLLVLGDSVAVPGLAPGIVVSQSPFPDARALRGGDISVMLSRM
jgi:hypothetical protein